MSRKKIIQFALIFVGALMILAGIIFWAKADTSHTGRNGGVSRASTSIEFGADFYTTSAQYTALAANAVSDTYKMISTGMGIFFIFIGAVDILGVLLLMFEDEKKAVILASPPVVSEESAIANAENLNEELPEL